MVLDAFGHVDVFKATDVYLETHSECHSSVFFQAPRGISHTTSIIVLTAVFLYYPSNAGRKGGTERARRACEVKNLNVILNLTVNLHVCLISVSKL